MVALRKPRQVRMNITDFLVWEPEDTSIRRWQLIDGEPVAMAPAAENHGALQMEIGRRLANHLIAGGSRCRVISEPGIQPRVRSEKNYRIPDLAVTCAPPSSRLLMTDPVLVVEILSPRNEAKTWSNVWTYTTIPSLREILIVSSHKIEAELLRRNDDLSWPETPLVIGADDSLTLDSVGFTVTLRAFYAATSLSA